MELFPHPLQTYAQLWRSYVWCEWRSLESTIIPYAQLLLAQPFDPIKFCMSHMQCKGYHGAVNEAQDSHHHGDDSQVMEGDWDPLSHHCLTHSWDRFWISTTFPHHICNAKDVMMQWLRLQTHMEWSSHPLQTYASSWRSFISGGGSLQSIITHMHNSCWHNHWISASFPCNTCNPTNVMVQWMRLQSYM